MKLNPVYKREVTVRSRSFRMPLIIMVFNGILAGVALLNMYSVVAQVKISAVVQYSSFLQLYVFVSTIEFLLLMFIMPALTSGSISGERERQTLELIFTTKMTPGEIIMGKLFSAINQMSILVVSSLPVLLLTFVYGGVSLLDLGFMLLCFAAVAMVSGGIGILSSCLMRRSTFSNVCTYGILLATVVGTYMVNMFALHMSQMQVNNAIVQMGETAPKANSGAAVYLLLLNPVVTFASILSGQTGDAGSLLTLEQFLGAQPENFVTAHWIVISLAVQLVLAVLLVVLAIRFLNPVKNERR